MACVTALADHAVVPIERLELRFAPRRWRFAVERRGEIEAYFAAVRRDKPALWNGRVLLLNEWTLTDGRLRGAFFETDFASFLAWRDWGFPDPSVSNCFAQGALRSADGAFLLGVMGAHTANAGRIYFPSGTPEPGDVRGGTVDLLGNVMRELAEETGLAAADVTIEPRWHIVRAGPRLALMKVLQVDEAADALRARILDFLGRQTAPELTDIRIARGRSDLDPFMPIFVTAFLEHIWRAR